MPSRRSPRATAAAMRGSSSATKILIDRQARSGGSTRPQRRLRVSDESPSTLDDMTMHERDTEPLLTERADADDPRAALEGALYELKRVIVGQDAMLERLLVALLAGGHVLLEGVPGLAKTLTVKTLAQTLGGSFRRGGLAPPPPPSAPRRPPLPPPPPPPL